MTNPELKKAEREVQQSTQEFDHAMGDLQKTVEHGARRVNEVIDTVRKPKEVIQDIATQTGQAVSETSEKAVHYLQERYQQFKPVIQDRRFQFGMAGVIVGVVGFFLYRRFSRNQEREIIEALEMEMHEPGDNVDFGVAA